MTPLGVVTVTVRRPGEVVEKVQVKGAAFVWVAAVLTVTV
jgi:hypothetical protein